MEEHKHETSDVRIRPVALFVGGLFVAVVVVLVVMGGLFRYFATHQPKPEIPPSPLVTTPQTPPEPRLQASPYQDVRELRAQDNQVLASYGWVDRQAGVVRIPIERAIEVLAQRGEPKK